MTATWINQSSYASLESKLDIRPGTLKNAAAGGEYLSNIVRRLPGGESGSASQALVAYYAERRKREAERDPITGREPYNGMC